MIPLKGNQGASSPFSSPIALDYRGVNDPIGRELAGYGKAIQKKIDASRSFDDHLLSESDAIKNQWKDKWATHKSRLEQSRISAEGFEVESRKKAQPVIDRFYKDTLGEGDANFHVLTKKDRYGNLIPDEGLIMERATNFAKLNGGDGNVANTLAAELMNRVNIATVAGDSDKLIKARVAALAKNGKALFPTEENTTRAAKEIIGNTKMAAESVGKLLSGKFESYVEKKKTEMKPLVEGVNEKYGSLQKEIQQTLVNDETTNAQFAIDQYKQDIDGAVSRGEIMPKSAQFRMDNFIKDTYERLNTNLDSQEFKDRVVDTFEQRYGEAAKTEFDGLNQMFQADVTAKRGEYDKRFQRTMKELQNINETHLAKLSNRKISKEGLAQLMEVTNGAFSEVMKKRNDKMSKEVEDDYKKSLNHLGMPVLAVVDFAKFFGDSFMMNMGNMMKSKGMYLNSLGVDGSFVDWLKQKGGSLFTENFNYTPELKGWNFLSPAFVGNSLGQFAYSVPSLAATFALSRMGLGQFGWATFGVAQTADNAATNSGDTYWQALQNNPGDIAGAQKAAEQVFGLHMLDLPLNMLIGRMWFSKGALASRLIPGAMSEYGTESYESASQNAVLYPKAGLLPDTMENWKGRQAQTEGIMAGFSTLLTGGLGSMASKMSNMLIGKANPGTQFLAQMMFDRSPSYARALFAGAESEYGEKTFAEMGETMNRIEGIVAEAKAMNLPRPQALAYVELVEKIQHQQNKLSSVSTPAAKASIEANIKNLEAEVGKLIDGKTKPVTVSLPGTDVVINEKDLDEILADEEMQVAVTEGTINISSEDRAVNEKIEAMKLKVAAAVLMPKENKNEQTVVGVAVNKEDVKSESTKRNVAVALPKAGRDIEIKKGNIAITENQKVNEEGTTDVSQGQEAQRQERVLTAQDPAAVQPKVVGEAAPALESEDKVKEARKVFNAKHDQDMATVTKGAIPGGKMVSALTPEGKKKKLDAMTRRLIDAKNEGTISEPEFSDKYDDIAIAYQKLAEKNPQYKAAAKEAVSAKEAAKAKPAFSYGDKTSVSIADVDALDEDGFKGVKRKVVGDVKRVVKSINGLVKATTGKGLTVTLHKDDNSFGEAVEAAGGSKSQDSKSKGFYLSSDGSIHLNMGRVTPETMLHEGFHPVLDYIESNNPAVIDKLFGQLGKTKEGKAFIATAKRKYSGDTTQKKEAITDFVAHVADGSIDINPSNFARVKAFIAEVLNKLGFDIQAKKVMDMTDAKELKNLAGLIKEKFSKGEEVESTDISLPKTEDSRVQFARAEAKKDDNPVFFENIKEFANQSSFKNKIEFKKAIGEISKKYLPDLKQKYGRDFNPSVYNETTKKYLSDILTKEAFNAIDAHPEAIGWYDQKTTDALSAISTIHPEIATDMEARGAFILPLAVMSNGNKVDKNFELAEQQYQHFKSTGRFNPNGGFGIQQAGIKKSLLLINKILDQGVSMAQINNFFTSQHLAGDLKYRKPDGKLGNLVSGELANEKVFGAVILGPKIGNGFYVNLWGEFGQLTMDRWFMRTWGRLTGTLIKENPKAVSGGKKELKLMIDKIKSDKALAKVLRDVIGPYSGKSMADIAFAIEKASADKETRKVLSLHVLTDELRKRGNTLAKNIRGEKEAPGNGEERRFIRGVFADIQSRLKEEYGIDITMADLQAVLWYPEKILYESFKGGESYEESSEGYTEDTAPDYFNAARNLAQKLGATDGKINQAVSDGRRSSEGRTRGGDPSTGGAISENNQRVLREVRAASGGQPELQKGVGAKSSPQFSRDSEWSLFSAPFYDMSLRDSEVSFSESADAARELDSYKEYVADIKKVSDLLDINIDGIDNLIGGFENESGKKIVEITAKTNIDVDDFNKAINLAAILGAIAPETQESTIAARYVDPGSAEHNADEYVVSISDVDKTIKALTDLEIFNFSINETTKELTLLNIFAFETANIDQILDNLAEKLTEYGVEHTESTRSAIQSEYIDYSTRQDIITKIQGDAIYEQKGQGFRDVLDRARLRNEEFIKRKQGPVNPQFSKTAPNGKPSNLTDAQYQQVRTPEFKNWFGDWESDPKNASKVVDGNGEPLVVYHGTSHTFDEFDGGNYFTDDYWNADGYAGGENVFEVYLNIRAPLVINSKGRKWDKLNTKYGKSTREITFALDEDKFDGVVFNNINDSWMDDDEVGSTGDVYYTPSSTQIKSATDNSGAFSTKDGRIQFSKADTAEENKSFAQGLIAIAIAKEATAETIKEIQGEIVKYFAQRGLDMGKRNIVNVMKQLTRLAEAGDNAQTLWDVLSNIDTVIAEQEKADLIDKVKDTQKKFKKFLKASKYLALDYRTKLNSLLRMMPSPVLMAATGADMEQYVEAMTSIMTEYGNKQNVRTMTTRNLDYMTQKLQAITKDIADYLDAKSLMRYNAERKQAFKTYAKNYKNDVQSGKVLPGSTRFEFPTYDEWMDQRQDMKDLETLEDKIEASADKGKEFEALLALVELQQERLKDLVTALGEGVKDEMSDILDRLINVDRALLREKEARHLISIINNITNDGNVQGAMRFLAFQDAQKINEELRNNPMRIRGTWAQSARAFGNLLQSLTFNRADAARLRSLFGDVSTAANKVQRMLYGFSHADGRGVIDDVYRIAKKMGKDKPLANFRVGVFQFLNQAMEQPSPEAMRYDQTQIDQRTGLQEFNDQRLKEKMISKQQDFERRLNNLIDGTVIGLYNYAAANLRSGGATAKAMMDQALKVADTLQQFGLIEGYTVVADAKGNKSMEVTRKDSVSLDGLYENLDDNEKELYDYVREKFADPEFLDKMKQVSEGLHGIPFNAIDNYAPQIAHTLSDPKASAASDQINNIGDMNFRGDGVKKVGVRPSDRFLQRTRLADPSKHYYSMDAISNFLTGYYEANLSIEGGEALKRLSYVLNGQDFKKLMNGVFNKAIDGIDLRYEKLDGREQYGMLLERFAEILRDTANPPFLGKDQRGAVAKAFEYTLSGITATYLQTSDQVLKQLLPNLAAGVAAVGMPETIQATRLYLQYSMGGTVEEREAFREFMRNFEGDFRSPMGEAAFDELNKLMDDYDVVYRKALALSNFKDQYTPARIGKWIFKNSDKVAYGINVISAYIDAEIKSGRLKSAFAFDIESMQDINKQSVADALNMAEMLNNASKSAERAPYTRMRQTDRNIKDQFIRNVMFLKGFSLNSFMGFQNNLAIALKSSGRATTDEKLQAGRRAMSYVAQIAVFNMLKVYMISPAFNILGDVLISNLFGTDLKDEPELEKRKRMAKRATQFWHNSAADALVGYMPSPVELGAKGMYNWLYSEAKQPRFEAYKNDPEGAKEMFGRSIPKSLKFESKAAKQLLKGTTLETRYNPFFLSDGGGIGSVEVYVDLFKSFEQAYSTRGGTLYSEETNRNLDKMDVAKMMAYITGQGDALKIMYGMERQLKFQDKLGGKPKSSGNSNPIKDLQKKFKSDAFKGLQIKPKGI